MSPIPKTVASLLLLGASAGALLHCSSSGNDSGGGNDAGTDSTVTNDGGPDTSTSDTSMPDTTSGTDASGDDGSNQDAGDAEVPDAFDGGTPCDAAGDAAEQCGASATAACCSGYCTDTALDPKNCGSCGNGCTLAQFCNGTKCNDTVFANVCGNPKATVVFDTFPPDNDAGVKVAQALHDNCVPQVTYTQQPDDSHVVDDAGRPILGVGNTYLIGGGWYGHAGMNYMDTNKLTRVQVNADATNSFIRKLSDNTDVVSVPTSSLTATHDYFIVELATEPVSGTLCFAATGMYSPGTDAAAWFLVNKVIPSPATYTDAWYAYGWDENDSTPGPSAGDTWTLLGSGK